MGGSRGKRSNLEFCFIFFKGTLVYDRIREKSAYTPPGSSKSIELPGECTNFPFGPWTIVHGGQKIESAQKIYACRG